MPISLPPRSDSDAARTPPRSANKPARFDFFVVLAEMRTGSNLLETNLNEFNGIECRGEVFNPAFIGHQGGTELFGVDIAARDRDPLSLLDAVKSQASLTGFRYFHDHDPRVCDAFLRDPTCAKIILTRNPVDSYVSLKIAKQTQQWKLGDVKTKRTAKVRFVPEEFETHVRALQDFQLHILRQLQITGQTAFHVPYEDANDVAVLNGLARWLGVADQITAPAGALKRQNPEPLEKKLVNPDEVRAGIARLDRFDLNRVPYFEPRRGAMIWAYRTCRSVPLVYAPIPGVRATRVLEWMAAIDNTPVDDLAEGFTVQSWRDWQDKTPGRIAFTVLHHPLERAHAVFVNEVLSGNRQNLRNYLDRVYQVRLPSPRDGAQLDLRTHREGFLAYLRFVEAALTGQSGIPVQPLWASQTRLLEGFAAQCPLHRVLLADEIDLELPRIATRLGRETPVPAARKPVSTLTLADIYSPEIEAAVRSAYSVDYRMIGFSNWTPPQD